MSSLHALCRTLLAMRPPRQVLLRLSTRLLDAGNSELRWN